MMDTVYHIPWILYIVCTTIAALVISGQTPLHLPLKSFLSQSLPFSLLAFVRPLSWQYKYIPQKSPNTLKNITLGIIFYNYFCKACCLTITLVI